MTKRPSLFSPAAKAEPPPPAPSPATPAPRKYPVAKTREGKRVATVYLEPEALRQLKRAAFDEDKTVQELLVEGVNAVFERRGLGRIA
jgi:hypothetical protein